MPALVFYRETDGAVPVLDWFTRIPQAARIQCIAKLELLVAHGHLLRRPHADFLRDGLHELRVKHRGVNYRLVYFFHGRQVVVVTQGFVKQRAIVPATELGRALVRMRKFVSDPESHSHRED